MSAVQMAPLSKFLETEGRSSFSEKSEKLTAKLKDAKEMLRE